MHDPCQLCHRSARRRSASPSTTAPLYCSSCVRTRQAAGHSGQECDGDSESGSGRSAEWYLNRTSRERDWGDVETRPDGNSKSLPMFELNVRKKAIEPLCWPPPGGESICDVAENRVRNLVACCLTTVPHPARRLNNKLRPVPVSPVPGISTLGPVGSFSSPASPTSDRKVTN